MDRKSKPLSTLMALTEAWNWVWTKVRKDCKIVWVFDLKCIRNTHVHLVKSSTIVRKKRAPKCVGILWGPQISQCNKSNGAWVDIKLEGNGNLVCLAIGQTLQLLSKETLLLGDNKDDTSFSQDGDGCPRRMCYRLGGWETWWEVGVLCNGDMQ